MPTLPRLRVVASETILTPAYQHFGKFRAAEPHVLFKYTLRGEGVFADETGEHRVGAGTGFLCEISDPRTRYFYPPDGKAPWTFVWMVFDGEAARQMARSIIQRHGALYTLARNGAVIQRLLEFRQYHGKARGVQPAWGAQVVCELLLALAASRESTGEDRPEQALIQRARRLVEEHEGETLTVTDLALRLAVSREHLTRTFTQETAQTPHDYLIRQKLLLACHLLKETSLSNKQVAAQLGYGEPSHFTRTFRRVMRMTPTQFRASGTIPMAWRLARLRGER